jgi:RNA polymerase sigma-70 factor (ECF subfamily)
MRLSDVDVVSNSGSSKAGAKGDAATFDHSLIAAVVLPERAVTGEVAEAVADFESVRPRLFGIAYRMLGGVADAEDVVQEVWLRWQAADRACVRDRVGYLVTITTRLALNAATSARARREVSVGRWLPERVSDAEEPPSRAERNEALDLAVRLLLERLSPIERAVYILREAFGYPFCEIATTLVIGESNARQLARRARMHLAEQRRMPADPEERGRLLATFIVAARAGDMVRLECLLIDDIASYHDRDRSGHMYARRSPVPAAGHSAMGSNRAWQGGICNPCGTAGTTSLARTLPTADGGMRVRVDMPPSRKHDPPRAGAHPSRLTLRRRPVPALLPQPGEGLSGLVAGCSGLTAGSPSWQTPSGHTYERLGALALCCRRPTTDRR